MTVDHATIEPRESGLRESFGSMNKSFNPGRAASNGLSAALLAQRDRVTTPIDPAVRPEQVDRTIVLKDGRTLHKFIEHAIGSVEVPMSDAQLETKFVDLADGILSKAKVKTLMDRCWHVEQLPSAAAIAKAGAA